MEQSKPRASRRRLPHRSFQRPIGILHRGQYYVGVGKEIGENGMRFDLSFAIPAGDKIVLSFQIPNGQFVSIVSLIKGTAKNPSGDVNHGTEFIDMRFDAKREIRVFVSSRAEHEEYLGLFSSDNAALMGLLRSKNTTR